jgi:hypothetical protein
MPLNKPQSLTNIVFLNERMGIIYALIAEIIRIT